MSDEHTLVTATWNSYSVIKLSVLLEKRASIPIVEPFLSGLDTSKEMLTPVFDTSKSLVIGKLALSSGSAEVKSQSSSADVPLLCWGFGRS